ncbi:MAG: sensor histidine kinase KdpD [candidate division NC10 bacterium]|nr:sensor histidine kinase KdpD [candidate division NC10 bacterium]MBI3086366.1 sensor histidine kinase KdpD [candidate division NC10 bacterium]
MKERGPDPDPLLARVKEEGRQRRGKLKVFFGAAAGVGKTYAMLQAAQERRAAGVDVAVGWVDTHGRAESAALLQGLEILPPRRAAYRGTTLQEFDLDAALQRRPTLILVDELAHSNAPGMRHAKRWQDVTELLDSGMDVYATLNVQHLESLNDVVARITGVTVRETVPDSVLEQAAEVELIDLPPEDLLQRLREGKVYVPEQAREAMQSFFQKGNLIALRELALRRTADSVDAQMREYMREHAIRKTWPVAERIMACVSPSPLASCVVRAAKRFADTLRAEWIVAYVETPGHARMSEAARVRIADTLRLAEGLGAETVVLSGHSVSDEILAHARARNVSKIVIGTPHQPFWRRILFGSIADTLIRRSNETDIYVISGEESPNVPYVPPARTRRGGWLSYVWAVAIAALCTAIAWVMFPFFELSNLIMVYLLGVVGVAARGQTAPSILASILSVATFDFFFVPPYFTFAVADKQYLVTFAVMLAVALVIGGLTVRIRWLAESARQRERRTAALYALSREQAGVREVVHILEVGLRHIQEVFRGQMIVLLPGPGGHLMPQPDLPTQFRMDSKEHEVSQWVFQHGQLAGRGTYTLPGAEALYLPLVASRGTLGVLGIQTDDPHALEAPEQLHQLEAFTNQIALALERAQLAEEAQQAHLRMETERLRSSLLSSVSHDLRTPLASITGAASSLLETGDGLSGSAHRELLETIHEEAERLSRLVHNLLEMTRLESGSLEVRKDWHPLEEVVGAALGRLAKQVRGRPVTTRLPAELPLVPMDDVLMEQVLINLLDNAIKHTPDGSPIELAAMADGEAVTVEVADIGPGLPTGDEQRIFQKFARGQPATSRGAGLGLAICQGIVEAHGGRIWAENRPGGGAVFRFTIPLSGRPPEIRASDT